MHPTFKVLFTAATMISTSAIRQISLYPLKSSTMLHQTRRQRSHHGRGSASPVGAQQNRPPEDIRPGGVPCARDERNRQRLIMCRRAKCTNLKYLVRADGEGHLSVRCAFWSSRQIQTWNLCPVGRMQLHTQGKLPFDALLCRYRTYLSNLQTIGTEPAAMYIHLYPPSPPRRRIPH